MTLSNEQLSALIENYANHIIDGMDTETLESLVYDLLVREYETHTEEQIIGEIQELYDNEVAAGLIESVGADPDTIL